MRVPLVHRDLASETFKRESPAVYARWRNESPVVRIRLRGPGSGTGEALVLTRYADVSEMLRDLRLVKDPKHAGKPAQPTPAIVRPLTRNMLALDDPDHARLRRIVQATFTPRRIATLEHRTQAASDALIERLRARRSFDLISDYAFLLPVTVISELLGVPERDRRRFARWSGALIESASSVGALLLAAPSILAFLRYLRRLIAMKRKEPGDDLVSALIEARADDERLDGDELMAMVAILLSAGHETTTNFIGNGMLALFEHPDSADVMREGGDIEPAVEELLRFAGPVETTTHRYASEDLVLAGVDVPRGTLVFGAIASANRDEQQFSDAGTLDLARTPNRHLTFGEGGHYCLGAALARLEARIAFRDLVTQMPRLRLATRPERIRNRPGLVLRGLRALPVAT